MDLKLILSKYIDIGVLQLKIKEFYKSADLTVISGENYTFWHLILCQKRTIYNALLYSI
jgi:hypothetical protein